jgi:hypothetical protein
MYFKLPQTPSRQKQELAHYRRLSQGISHLHDSLNIESLRDFIHHLTAKCPFHPNPLVQQIGNYTLADLNSIYKIYKHK